MLLSISAIAIVLLLGSCTDSDGLFPQSSDGRRFFDEHRVQLNALLDQIEDDGSIVKIACHQDVVFVTKEPDREVSKLQGTRMERYISLCRAANAAQGWRIDNGFLLYSGGASSGDIIFNIALIRYDAPNTVVPDCQSIETLGKVGSCDFRLDDSWVLNYEWYSQQFIENLPDEET